MQITRITYGETALPESMVFFGGDKDKKVPIILSFFLIQTRGKNILVDAGCEDLPGFELKNFRSAMTALKEQRIDLNDITDVVITHAHHDHAPQYMYFAAMSATPVIIWSIKFMPQAANSSKTARSLLKHIPKRYIFVCFATRLDKPNL